VASDGDIGSRSLADRAVAFECLLLLSRQPARRLSKSTVNPQAVAVALEAPNHRPSQALTPRGAGASISESPPPGPSCCER
jgi:hypothetical protein